MAWILDYPDIMLTDELIVELSTPNINNRNGTPRATARVRISSILSNETKRVEREQFLFVSPLGRIEREELRWYLEQYYHWPEGVFLKRARKVETHLEIWGQKLYNALHQSKMFHQTLTRWKNSSGKQGRRLTISVAPRTAIEKNSRTKEAATWLLSLPWELLHDETNYLLESIEGFQICRRLVHNHNNFERSLSEVVSQTPPVRLLLICPRPEDDIASYLDHRSSARSVVEAFEKPGELTELVMLTPSIAYRSSE